MGWKKSGKTIERGFDGKGGGKERGTHSLSNTFPVLMREMKKKKKRISAYITVEQKPITMKTTEPKKKTDILKITVQGLIHLNGYRYSACIYCMFTVKYTV